MIQKWDYSEFFDNHVAIDSVRQGLIFKNVFIIC